MVSFLLEITENMKEKYCELEHAVNIPSPDNVCPEEIWNGGTVTVIFPKPKVSENVAEGIYGEKHLSPILPTTGEIFTGDRQSELPNGKTPRPYQSDCDEDSDGLSTQTKPSRKPLLKKAPRTLSRVERYKLREKLRIDSQNRESIRNNGNRIDLDRPISRSTLGRLR